MSYTLGWPKMNFQMIIMIMVSELVFWYAFLRAFQVLTYLILTTIPDAGFSSIISIFQITKRKHLNLPKVTLLGSTALCSPRLKPWGCGSTGHTIHHGPDSSIAVKRNQTMTEKEQWGEVEVWSFAVRAGVWSWLCTCWLCDLGPVTAAFRIVGSFSNVDKIPSRGPGA